jgi:hypothetical protein
MSEVDVAGLDVAEHSFSWRLRSRGERAMFCTVALVWGEDGGKT